MKPTLGLTYPLFNRQGHHKHVTGSVRDAKKARRLARIGYFSGVGVPLQSLVLSADPTNFESWHAVTKCEARYFNGIANSSCHETSCPVVTGKAWF